MHNPVDDRLIVARADGQKGSTYLDYVCFDIMRDSAAATMKG